MIINDKATILFQGDSITDAGRNRNISENLGGGYASVIAGLFPVLFPETNVRFLNRGNSGNRVSDLEARWDEDCINLKPDVVSILIGVNDCLRNYDSNLYTSPEQFEQSYRNILERTVKELDAALIIIEPFLLPVNSDIAAMRADLDPKIQVVRKLAREYKAVFLPFDGTLAMYSIYKPCEFWAADGVHLTREGNSLLAQNWLDAID